MPTNLDLDLQALDELMQLGGFSSKRQAVDQAVREALALRRQLQSRELLGTIDFGPVPPRSAAAS